MSNAAKTVVKKKKAKKAETPEARIIRLAKQKVCRDKRRASGKCSHCQADALKPCTRCADCLLKDQCLKTLKCKARWVEMKDLQFTQNNRCPLTGFVLVPGRNISIDHIIPRHRGGTHDPVNIRLVDKAFNTQMGFAYEVYKDTPVGNTAFELDLNKKVIELVRKWGRDIQTQNYVYEAS